MYVFTIIVVEVNPVTSKILKNALEPKSYQVIEAVNGKTALECIHKYQPDLVLQDLFLPDMNGIELNLRIRALPEGSEIPVIALSGFLFGVDEIEIVNNGFNGFLLKPVDISHLFEVISAYIPHDKTAKNHEGYNKKVIIADDNVVQSKSIRIKLTNLGYQVKEAKDGNEVFEMIKHSKPDILISDVLMPGLDGFELCIKIRSDPTLKNLPIILMSSHYIEKSDQQFAKEIGVNYYLTRKTDINELLSALENCCNDEIVVPKFPAIPYLKAEHDHRLIRQLEHQLNANAGFRRRCALQSALLLLMEEMANALTDSKIANIDTIFQNVLGTCLDAAGVSKGALFLFDSSNQLKLQHTIGYAMDSSRKVLEDFFSKFHLLSQVITKKETILIPSAGIDEQVTRSMQTKLAVVSALLVPLVSGQDCYGMIFLGSTNTLVTGSDLIIFAHAIGNQIGLTIRLSRSFEQIRSSERRYRILMDKASCGILTHDEMGIINGINKMGERILGDTKDNIIGTSIYTFIPATVYEQMRMNLSSPQTESRPASIEVHLKQAHGEECNVEVLAASIDLEDEKQFLVILNDVTERNKLRSQAYLNDKLTTVGTLAAGIAHEINNPIAWVLANLGYLKSYIHHLTALQDELYQIALEPEKDAKMLLLENVVIDSKQHATGMKFEEIVDETLQGAERVRDIVLNLKGFARVDQVKLAPADLHQIINTSISMAVPEFKYRARMEKIFLPNLPKLMLNSNKMHQIFLNLILNAAQAIPDGDTENNKIQITTQMEGDMVRVDISDTGKGIPPEVMPKIFEPFFTTKPVGVGSGLGLSICYDMIKSLGGKIEVHSTVGKGTIFSVYIPFQLETKTAKVAVERRVSDRRKKLKKVLVIEDETSLLKSLERMLEEDHHVTCALGGKAALEMLAKQGNNFDAIISDLSMPDVNGADVYSYVAENYPGLEKKIIFITGGIYIPTLIDFFSHIKNIHLEKPFKQNDLLEAIHEITMDEKE